MEAEQMSLINQWIQYFKDQEAGFTTSPPSSDPAEIETWAKWYNSLPKSQVVEKTVASTTPNIPEAIPEQSTALPETSVSSVNSVKKPYGKYKPRKPKPVKPVVKAKREKTYGLVQFMKDF